MNYYKMTAILSYRGLALNIRSWDFLKEEQPQNHDIEITWKNINEICKYATCEIKDCRYGLRLRVLGNASDEMRFKQWKERDLTLKVKIMYKMIEPSINDILAYPDGEAAINYLLERGMNVIAAAE